MNTPNSPQQYQEKMQALRYNYLQRLKKNLREVRRLKELLLKNLAPLKDLQEASRLAHNLTGSGATFGFPAISQNATQLQQSLKTLIDANSASRNSDRERQDCLEKIDIFYETSRLAIADNSDMPQTIIAKNHIAKNNTGIIGILSRKENVVTDEIQYLERQGYQVIHAENFQALQAITNLSAALISDDLCIADEQYLKDSLLQNQKINLSVPFAFRLKRDDFKSRLQALKLGAKSFFALDTSGKELDNTIKSLIDIDIKNEPSILIITKDEMLAGLYEHILEQAGMKICVLTSNKDPLKLLIDENIDLVIADYDLPFSNGKEFIDVLKQSPEFSSLPVIFMSTKEEYQSFDIPPDYTTFLLKPFTPDKMIKAIQHQLTKNKNLI